MLSQVNEDLNQTLHLHTSSKKGQKKKLQDTVGSCMKNFESGGMVVYSAPYFWSDFHLAGHRDGDSKPQSWTEQKKN